MKKNLFKKPKFNKEKLSKFLDKEGFYITLFLCITLIITSAVFITSRNFDYFTKNSPNNEIAQNSEDLTKDNESEDNSLVDTDVNINPPKDNSSSNEINTTQDKPSDESKPVSTVSTNPLNELSCPVKSNKITMDFSYGVQPVFSTTLQEYRSDHRGIDIQANLGEEVTAAYKGRVVKIHEDGKLGYTIVIDHGSGIKTIYSNLDKSVNVTLNENVKEGQVIGTIGNTASFEVADPEHIHFEVWKDDQCLNPKDYISFD